MREARAYNNSILFMLSVPYALLGVGGFLVFRGLRHRSSSTPESTSSI